MVPTLGPDLTPFSFLICVSENGLPSGPAWGALDDVVMGGISESGFQVDRSGGEDGTAVGVFKGDFRPLVLSACTSILSLICQSSFASLTPADRGERCSCGLCCEQQHVNCGLWGDDAEVP